MEYIHLRHYSYRPRLRLGKEVLIPEPQVNDIMLIPIDWFDEVNKELRKKIYSHIKMRVVRREINCAYFRGPILIVHLELAEDC